jgi:hypothetical protein
MMTDLFTAQYGKKTTEGDTMAMHVNDAFDEFISDKVNLDINIVNKARTSRDWLIEKIAMFPNNYEFPKLYADKNIFFGSFARKTKKRELDDIDIMIALHAQGSLYNEYHDHIEIIVCDESVGLLALCNPNTNTLNSIKVLNKLKNCIGQIAQYSQADIGRDHEAVVLSLNSYSWSFDIVPCFFTTEDYRNNTYYLIPNGQGHWKKTDPRLDRERVSTINQKHGGNVLNVIRLCKYWNKRPTMPSIPSYMFENMILDYYDSIMMKDSYYLDLEFRQVVNYIKHAIYNPVWDPKKIQGDLNNIGTIDRIKISQRAERDFNIANQAWEYETSGDHKKAIDNWRTIFGSEFPSFS